MMSDNNALTDFERAEYARIRKECECVLTRRCPTEAGVSALAGILKRIRAFEECGGPERHRPRAIACGAFWLSACGVSGIVINTAQLGRLLGKKRSWINDFVARLGYEHHNPDIQRAVAVEIVTFLGKQQPSRPWTFRRHARQPDQPHFAPGPVSDEEDEWDELAIDEAA
jgi:hypothetical protein